MIWIVFDVDPDIGQHELEGQQSDGCGEADAGKKFEQGAGGSFIVLIVLYFERGGLGEGRRGSANGLGGRLKLDSSLGQCRSDSG